MLFHLGCRGDVTINKAYGKESEKFVRKSCPLVKRVIVFTNIYGKS